MEVHLAEQTASFLYAAVLGLCLGGVYDFFRCLRALTGGRRWMTALCDLLFSFVCMGSYFLFSLTFSGGVLRGYTLLGAALAMLLYFTGPSPFLMALFLPLTGLARRGTERAGRRLAGAGRSMRRRLRACLARGRDSARERRRAEGPGNAGKA